MGKRIIINVEAKIKRVALVVDEILEEIHFDHKNSSRLTGSMFQGKVTRVMPGIEAAFVNIGLKKNGFLHISDITDERSTLQDIVGEDFDEEAAAGPDARQKGIEEYHKTGKPLLLALHGRPENSFLLERYKKSAVISVLRKVAKEGKYRGVFTFWDEYVFPMECITEMKVDYIPAPVNLDVFNPIGIKHKFKKNGNPNIVILDRWREDTSPFNLIFAAEYFKKKYYPDAKLHIYGVPRGQKTCLTFLVPFIKNG